MLPRFPDTTGTMTERSNDPVPAALRPSLVALAVLALLVALAFGRGLGNGFAYDDHFALLGNPAVTTGASVGKILVDPSLHTSADLVQVYRPLRTLVFAAQYAWFGESAGPYHAVNLLLHLANAWLIWRLARRWFGEAGSLLVAGLFAAHPLQSEVVCSIKAQDDLLAALAVLGALLIFRRWRERGGRAGGWLVLGIFVAGLFAKECVLVLPGLLFLLALFEPGPRDLRTVLRAAPWRLLAATLAVGLLFLLLRDHLLSGVDVHRRTGEELSWLFPSSLAQLPRYTRLFLLPWPLTVDYSGLPILSLTSPLFLGSVAGQLVVLGLLAVLRQRLLWIGWLWFHVAILPGLNLVGSYPVFGERFAYLASIGLCMIAVAISSRLVPAREDRRIVRLLLPAASVLFALASVSFVRTGAWKDGETLFAAAVAVDPDSSRMRSALVSELLAKGRTDEAREFLGEYPESGGAVPRSFAEREPLAQQGLLALHEGDHETAARIFARIVRGPHHKWHDWLNYGTALTNLSRPGEARAAFDEVLRIRPENAAARRMLGRLDLEEGAHASAAERLRHACELEPMNALGWYFLVFATWKSKGETAALDIVREAAGHGVSLRGYLAQDPDRWEGAGEGLRSALE
jgi:protein O-mannosyl-transferase